MSYSGPGPTGSDYAFDGAILYIGKLGEGLLRDVATSLEESKPPPITAGLKMIRALAKEFRNAASVGFRGQDYRKVKADFEKWATECGTKTPNSDAFIQQAREELALYESEVIEREESNRVPASSDEVSDRIVAYIGVMRERYFVDVARVLEIQHKEQRIIAGLKIIRVIAREFHKEVELGFPEQDYERAKDGFEKWYEMCGKKVPKKYRDEFIKLSREELALFESEVLGR